MIYIGWNPVEFTIGAVAYVVLAGVATYPLIKGNDFWRENLMRFLGAFLAIAIAWIATWLYN